MSDWEQEYTSLPSLVLNLFLSVLFSLTDLKKENRLRSDQNVDFLGLVRVSIFEVFTIEDH